MILFDSLVERVRAGAAHSLLLLRFVFGWKPARYGLGTIIAALFLPLLPASTTGVSRTSSADGGRLLDERSPGRRPAGALFQTKPARRVAALAPGGPQQRVLPTVRDRPEIPGLAFGQGPAPFATVPPFGAFAPPLGPTSLGGPAGAGPFGPNPITQDDTGPVTPPEGETPGGGPPGGVPPGGGPVLPDNPVVPEPSTWVMMIAGFGLLGLSVRQRRRDARRRQQG